MLSNIVLNELDWWISSQWETMPMRKNYVRTRKDNGVAEKTYAYKVLREKSRLKECFAYGMLMTSVFSATDVRTLKSCSSPRKNG